MQAKSSISSLLSQGDVNIIAKKLNLSPGAISAALRRANPGHPAVQEALRMASATGALEAAQALAKMNVS